jgi:acetyl-CoA synthetase
MSDQYQDHHNAWHWKVPSRFNIADAILGNARIAPWPAERRAIVIDSGDGSELSITYSELRDEVARVASALSALGVLPGERVAICLPQRIETAVAHLAVYAMGAVAVPLTVLFGQEAMQFRLADAGCVLAVCDATSFVNLTDIRAGLPQLRNVVVCDEVQVSTTQSNGDVWRWRGLPSQVKPLLRFADTAANDAALVIYTSGTTGPPKGALIPHRALIGNWSGFLYSHNLLPHTLVAAGEPFVFWSPADWAWTGGLWDALLPTLYAGGTLIGSRARFDAERAFELMARHEVTSAFLFPTALKMMMKSVPEPSAKYALKLRTIMSAGESVGEVLCAWLNDALGITVNEMFGQTELNYIVGNCSALWPVKPGSMGRGYPGHRVAIIDDEGNVLPAGAIGDVAVNCRDVHGASDPVFFLSYLNNAAATEAKYSGDWCRTGDMARLDEDGYLWYEGRSDDVIKSAGYRIGPAEVESCLIRHPAIAMAAVIGKPDAERGSIVKAFIVLVPGERASPVLETELAQHVRQRLAPYEYPKEFEFVEELPMTTTGKIQRKVLRDREAQKSENQR